ncbi:MAG TPA: DinB family protein, partial [Longimicrobiales bacterium]|nr:DinB family protein [Longimicrobiales bacterium]
APAAAQSAAAGGAAAPAADFRTEFLGQFDASAAKLVALAEAMPAERFDWRPAEGVASVAEAYTHIAHYNYLYPREGLRAAVPAGVDLGVLGGLSGKVEVVDALRASLEHVRTTVSGMSDADLEAPARLYGRDITRWAVLFQLITHMNEHLGQEIAYARMNGVVPPWSR